MGRQLTSILDVIVENRLDDLLHLLRLPLPLNLRDRQYRDPKVGQRPLSLSPIRNRSSSSRTLLGSPLPLLLGLILLARVTRTLGRLKRSEALLPSAEICPTSRSTGKPSSSTRKAGDGSTSSSGTARNALIATRSGAEGEVVACSSAREG